MAPQSSGVAQNRDRRLVLSSKEHEYILAARLWLLARRHINKFLSIANLSLADGVLKNEQGPRIIQMSMPSTVFKTSS